MVQVIVVSSPFAPLPAILYTQPLVKDLMARLDIEVSDFTASESRTLFPDPRSSEDHQTLGTVRVFRTIQELEELREPWNLWCDDPAADMDFYLASARNRSDFVRPHVMVAYRNGHPDCMLVGRLERSCLKLKVGYTILFQPTAKQLFFLQGGVLGNPSPENCRLLVQELKRHLENREAEVIELTRLTKDSELYRSALLQFRFFSRGHFSPLHEHRWLELPGTFKEFFQGLSRKNRHELRRHERKLSDDFAGKTHIHCYRHEGEVNELAEEVEKISAKTYQRALGVGFQLDTEILESLRMTARKGGLRACVLYVDETPCSFFIGKQYKDKFHGFFMGFDPKFGKYSPGLLVLLHSIEECFDPNMRATEIDLGWGDRQYKRIVCNHSRQDGPVYLYAPSWSGLWLNLLRSTTCLLDHSAKRLLAKSGFLQKLKKEWQENRRSSGLKRNSF
jgi:hypothetical protein